MAKKHTKQTLKDPAYYLTMFTLEGHETWRCHLSGWKDGFEKEWNGIVGQTKPVITQKNVIRIDRLTGTIKPL